MRVQRPGMVQTRTQYEFIHDYLDLCLQHWLHELAPFAPASIASSGGVDADVAAGSQ
jgi:hypothetical protein